MTAAATRWRSLERAQARGMRTSSSGLAPILWIVRSAPRRSSSAASLKPNSVSTSEIDDETSDRRIGSTHHAADELRPEAHAAHAAEHRQPEDAAGDAAPQPAQAMQRPYAEHVVELPLGIGRRLEGVDEDRARNAADHQRADRDA